MTIDLFGEPRPDSRLGEALRRGEPSRSTVSDDELRSRIVRAARRELGRLRRPSRSWWEWTAAWARVAMPVGLAASLAAGALLLRSTDPSASAWGATESSVMLGAGAGAVTGSEVGDQLLAEASDGWLLTQALYR
jgi:hypothetical protein